jgi:hypothetical protein
MVGDPRRRLRLSVAAVLALVAVLAAGAPPHTGAAGDAPVAIHTDFTGSVTLLQDGEPVTRHFGGSLDVNLSLLDFSMRLLIDTSADGQYETVMSGGRLYTRAPGRGWQPASLPDEMIQMLGEAGTLPALVPVFNPNATLRTLEQMGMRPQLLGEGTLSGQAVARYRIDGSLPRLRSLITALLSALEAARLDLPFTATEVDESFPPPDLTLELWTGVEDSFPYRLLLRLDLDGQGIALTADSIPLDERVEIGGP